MTKFPVQGSYRDILFDSFVSVIQIQKSFITSHPTYYNIQHRYISINYKYQYKYSNKLSWECSEIRARYHPNPTPDRWPLESLPLGSETGIQVSAVVGIGDHLGRQLPVSLLVPVAVTSVDTTLLPTKFWRRNRVEPEVGALVSILKFGNPQASVIGIGGRLEGSGSLSPSERWFHYS